MSAVSARVVPGSDGRSYTVGRGCGKGSFGRVKTGVCNETGQVGGGARAEWGVPRIFCAVAWQ